MLHSNFLDIYQVYIYRNKKLFIKNRLGLYSYTGKPNFPRIIQRVNGPFSKDWHS